MQKVERENQIIRRANEMARSGAFRNYQAVEIALRAEGYSEAKAVLDNRHRRAEIDAACLAARNNETAND
jgi:hypothetical protein